MTLKYSLCLFYCLKLEVERSLFNNEKTRIVWGLINTKIAGKALV